VRRWLLLSYLSVVAIVLALLEIPLGVLTARHERDLLDVAATQQATSVAVLVGEDLDRGRVGDLAILSRTYRRNSTGQILVVNTAGRPLVDSDRDGFGDYRQARRMLAAALAGRTVVENASDDGQPVTVAAVPVRNDNGSRVNGALILALPATPSYNRIRDVWYALGAFGLVILLITALVGDRLAKAITRPLGALAGAVGRFGAGYLAERARPSGPPELRELGAEFNIMASHIEDLLAAQARFVADASHQLRSPLTALRLRLENLEAAVEDSPELTHPVVAARREVQRLSRLVDGLLTLSRADGAPAERVPVDVGEVIAGRVDAWSALADERGVRLEASVAGMRNPTVPLVPGDLEQILDNLLANALDATPDGRSITVEVAGAETTVTITVTDEGSGMTPEELARAFDRFWQGGGKHKGSSGLGLAIVRQLARRNGAAVELRAAPGGGGGRGADPPAAGGRGHRNGSGGASGAGGAGGLAGALAGQPVSPGGAPARGPATATAGARTGLQAVIRLDR
jgi:signal transduction histidine kinase